MYERAYDVYSENLPSLCVSPKVYRAAFCRDDSRYSALPIHEIDEYVQSELADSYDYWYVPSFFIGKKKLHEGHAEYADIKNVLDAALLAD